MGDYLQLVSQEKHSIYVPKRIADLSEFFRKEIEKVEQEAELKIELPDLPCEVVYLLVDFLNDKYYYEEMKEIKAIPNEDYPIPENLSLDVVKKYL